MRQDNVPTNTQDHSSVNSVSSGNRNDTEKKPSGVPLAEIEAAIRRTRHGVVQIIIQDGVVVQIDRTEKLRLR
jgi:hypothetical protein